MTERPTPYELVFEELGPGRFPAIERALRAAGHDPRDPAAFPLAREAVELLQELLPEGGLGAAIEGFVGFVQAAFVHWLDGRAVVTLDRATLDRILQQPPAPVSGAAVGSRAGRSYYLQLPPQRVWGTPVEGEPPEPLDGGFVDPRGDLAVVGIFGLHPGRAGFTVATASGPRPAALARRDRTALFAPRFEAAAGTGLFSLAGTEELLELAYRCDALLGADGAAAGRNRVAVG